MADPKDKVTVVVDGKEFFGWDSIDIHLSMDSYSVVDLTSVFEPDNAVFREVYRPFSFKPIEVMIDGKQCFKGVLVGIAPSSDSKSGVVTVSAYSLPGALADCPAPARAVPIEFNKLGLRAIASTVAKPFGIQVDFRGPEGARFDKVKLDVETKVHEFLSELARQRSLVVSNTPDGKLLCWEAATTGSPIARLKDGEPPVYGVYPQFDPQEYFSEITGFVRAKRGRKGSKYTEQNPFLQAVLRPMSFKLEDTEKADAPQAVRAKLGRMFANMASFTVDVATWRDPSGKLWEPNKTLMLTAPIAMVYKESELLLRNVTLHQDKSSSVASLGLVLPGSFSGVIPKVLPWAE